MTVESNETNIYSQDVIEFVTVATEYCVRMEHSGETELRDFVPTMLKILPLLYLKALLLSGKFDDMEEDLEELVSEDDYNYVLSGVASVMGSHDDYLDVFVEDMKYSDTPVRKTISEDLADIYQDLRNFVGIYKQGFEESMNAALFRVMDSFPHYWGQRIPSVMRALHDVMFLQEIDEEQN